MSENSKPEELGAVLSDLAKDPGPEAGKTKGKGGKPKVERLGRGKEKPTKGRGGKREGAGRKPKEEKKEKEKQDLERQFVNKEIADLGTGYLKATWQGIFGILSLFRKKPVRKLWLLDDSESETLSKPSYTVAKLFITELNVLKWFALTTLFLSVLAVMAEKGKAEQDYWEQHGEIAKG